MIEFKAECGHTIRAKDEDAGGVVRCSYCGKEAGVPEGKNDSLDFLFQDAPQGEESADKKAKRKRSWNTGIFIRRGRKEFDPFAVVLKLCYAALLIIIVIVVGAKFFKPFVTEWLPELVASWFPDKPTPPPPSDHDNDNQGGDDKPSRRGYIGHVPEVFIASTPPGATGYWGQVPKHLPTRSIYHEPRTVKKFDVGKTPPDLRESQKYLVEIVFPLASPELAEHLGESYVRFRKSIISTSDDKKRRKLANEYFLPDGADDVFIDELQGLTCVVRRYQVSVPRKGRAKPIRALFLPRNGESGAPLHIKELLSYIPDRTMYNIDDEYVERELLEFYDVPEGDEQYVREALSRIGVCPYTMPDGRMHLFKIHPESGIIDGEFL